MTEQELNYKKLQTLHHALAMLDLDEQLAEIDSMLKEVQPLLTLDELESGHRYRLALLKAATDAGLTP